ncbi:IPT/TIG domain-containing protein [Streptosporangium sp. NPDC051023]|uniref:IPT/TIG domain-containing protein n=1 Tax=Streptosporangium sp. NPDC051023 TaxID=3155410 RepID=UPI00344C8376
MALVRENGTALAKAPGSGVLESVTDTDPLVKVKIAVYKDSPYDNVELPTQMRQLRFRAGQIIRQSEWDAEFVVPTIVAVSPATGLAAGGTVITITGSGFTADTTVTVGGNAATAIDVDTAAKVKATTAAHTAGVVDVVVTTAGGSATKVGGFTFT